MESSFAFLSTLIKEGLAIYIVTNNSVVVNPKTKTIMVNSHLRATIPPTQGI